MNLRDQNAHTLVQRADIFSCKFSVIVSLILDNPFLVPLLCKFTNLKLGPVTKLDKKNKTTSKKFDVDVMSESCDVIVVFRIFGQFGAFRRPDSGHRVCKSYVFSNSSFCLTKPENRTKKSLTQLSHYCFG